MYYMIGKMNYKSDMQKKKFTVLLSDLFQLNKIVNKIKQKLNCAILNYKFILRTIKIVLSNPLSDKRKCSQFFVC